MRGQRKKKYYLKGQHEENVDSMFSKHTECRLGLSDLEIKIEDISFCANFEMLLFGLAQGIRKF